MTFLIARIDAALAGVGTRIGNTLCNALDAALAGVGTKLCNALDASLYHDWDLEDTPNGADPLADDDLGPLPCCCGGIVGPHLAVSQARPAPRADRWCRPVGRT